MKKILVAIACSIAVGQLNAEWLDRSPVGENTVVADLQDGSKVRIDALAENLFRVRKSADGAWKEGGLNRYGILGRFGPVKGLSRTGTGFRTPAAEISAGADGAIRLKSLVSPADMSVGAKLAGKGYEMRFPLADGERIYGLGDVSRRNIQRRPGKYEIWVKNVNSYIPIPMVLSSRGWGVLVNTTWRNFFDVGETEKDAMVCSAPQSSLDFYVFVGKGYRELLDAYTRLTGRPQLLPIFGYGFTYVTNENVDMFELVKEAREFRDRDLPCDVIGLEPGWMETIYDYSTLKVWDPKKFVFPYWAPKGGHTFVGALNRMGFKLSLWLCIKYDLFRYEEQCAAGRARKFGLKPDIPDDVTETWEDDRITGELKDPRLVGGKGGMYKKLGAKEGHFKEGDLPWFEHLKKFVDQGAQCFKLDGSCQVTEWNGVKNRKWANGMSDEENHNLYPLVYGKQMSQGYEEYTRNRSMVYSAGGYAGIQQFVATWAGDTGGGAGSCASLLNLGMTGHPNQSCDMGIFDPKSLHFGMLQTWSQLNNWAYWFQPWLQRKAAIDNFRNYLKLRYRLIPYIYTAAAEAHETGWPVMRPLPFVYPENPAYDECKTTYMLGDSLLVCAFTNTASIPPGTWYEWRGGERIEGPRDLKVDITPEWGGGLFVKAGAAIPTWPETECLDKGWNREVVYEVYAGADGDGSLYEDNGITLDYRKGGAFVANTALKVRDGGDAVKFAIGPRRGGSFGGARNVTVRFHGFAAKPKSATAGGQPAEGSWDESAGVFAVGPVKVPASGMEFSVAR